MEFDAIVLAGGRSSRLGGIPKATLVYHGETLLRRAVQATAHAGARRTVVVGPTMPWLAAEALFAREDPHFSGPAAGIAAGLAALAGDGQAPARWTLVLACDMPFASSAIGALLGAFELLGDVDGVVADAGDGHRQHLAGFYDTDVLTEVAAGLDASGTLINASVRALLANLELVAVPVPEGSTDDVDTWHQAEVLGVTAATQRNDPAAPAT